MVAIAEGIGDCFGHLNLPFAGSALNRPDSHI
jgi:hypothetical protein